MAPARFRLSSPQTWVLPGPWGVMGIIAGAIVLGIGAGWFTTMLPRWLAEPDVDPSPSADPSPTETIGPVIPVDFYPPITREIDTDDLYSGLNALEIPTEGSGVFVTVSGIDEPESTGPIHWVRIEIEEGLPLTPDALGVYVMSVINDERGWGARGRMAFARTDGAAEFRIVFATPTTAARLCPRPHEAAKEEVDPPSVVVVPTASPTPTFREAEDVEPSCAEQGLIVVNAYRWAAGVASFEDDRVSARIYLLNHFLGHVLGYSDTTCTQEGGRASVMVDHDFIVAPCLPGPWPNPITS